MPTDTREADTPTMRASVLAFLWRPSVRTVLARLPVARRIYDGWTRPHPFDALLGIDTSGSVAASVCAPERAHEISAYGGSQPSIVRRTLHALPEHARYAFMDIGCGKGRPLVVASEFPFRRIVGVELSSMLAAIGRANAAAVTTRHPDRTPIEVDVGDATAVDAPADRVVYFLYHPFGRGLIEAFLRNVERHLDGPVEHAFIVYYNPVHGEVMDESARLVRWSSEMFPYSREEIGFGPDLADTVVVWQTRPERYAARPAAQRAIAVTGDKADLKD